MTTQPPSNSTTGRSAFLAVLRDEGISVLFGNPGTTELPIMHALTEQSGIEFVLALQESIVVAMADGYARAGHQLAACNVHVAPGLGNAIGTLYTAYISGTPLIITAGQQEQGHGLTEPLLYAPLVPIAQPVVKWAVEVTRIEDLPRILHRAAKIALTPPTGPVFISLPGDILNMEAALDLGSVTRVDTATRPTSDNLDKLANKLINAQNPVMIAGEEIANSDAFAQAAELASTLGVPVFQQTIAHGAHFPSEHPNFIGQLSRSQPAVRKKLEQYDLMLCVGADVLKMSVWDEVDPLPEHVEVIQIGQRDWEMGKNYATSMALRADVKATLDDLNPRLRELGGADLAARADTRTELLSAQNWTSRRSQLLQTTPALANHAPIAARWLMMEMVKLLPKNAIVVDEGVTTSGALLNFLPIRGRDDFFGNASGGIGWGIAAAVGVQLAQPQRRVVAIIGDGSAMYSIQALWTAAKHALPMIFVLANNGGYRIIKQRLKLFHDNEQFIGMDFEEPGIDGAGLATAFGMKGVKATTAEEFSAAMCSAVAGNEPVLIEAFVERDV